MLRESRSLAIAMSEAQADACAVRIRLCDAYVQVLADTLRGLGLMARVRPSSAAALVLRAWDSQLDPNQALDPPEYPWGEPRVCEANSLPLPGGMGGR